MGFGLFDSANLASLGYAVVAGDGTLIAGDKLRVERLAQGQYRIHAPTDINSNPLPIFSPGDVRITSLNGAGATYIISSSYQSETFFLVMIVNPLSGPIDWPFSVVVLRGLVASP
jgi:hypothetical protein